ncbi:MAG: hypothetical protein V4475_21785 [Pseudomonadota bacterium]
MTDGRLFLGIVTLVCIGVFLNGLRFLRMATQPRAERRILGLPAQSSHLPDDRLRAFGRLQMAVAPLAWLFFVALCFGLLGPIKGISPIHAPWNVR